MRDRSQARNFPVPSLFPCGVPFARFCWGATPRPAPIPSSRSPSCRCKTSVEGAIRGRRLRRRLCIHSAFSSFRHGWVVRRAAHHVLRPRAIGDSRCPLEEPFLFAPGVSRGALRGPARPEQHLLRGCPGTRTVLLGVLGGGGARDEPQGRRESGARGRGSPYSSAWCSIDGGQLRENLLCGEGSCAAASPVGHLGSACDARVPVVGFPLPPALSTRSANPRSLTLPSFGHCWDHPRHRFHGM